MAGFSTTAPRDGSLSRAGTAPTPRVVVATRHYAPEPTGSAPVMQEIVEWLASHGTEVDVITVRPSYPAKVILPGYAKGERDRAVEGGARIVRLATTPVSRSSLYARAIPEIKFMIDLVVGRATGRFSPADSLISLCPSILTVTGALALTSKVGRHIAVVHDIPSGLGSALGLNGRGVTMKLLRAIEVWTLNRVDHVVVLSDEMEAALRAIGVRTPIAVLPPHINTKLILPQPRPSGAPPTIMYSGNLGRKQGLEQLIDLARVLQERDPRVRVLVRGEGSSRQSLVEAATAQNLTNIVFEPLVPKDQIARSLAEGDVHLIPQLPEGQAFAVPSKVFAIMAAGRPFIATANAGSPLANLTDSVEAGISVPPGDIDAFANAALRLLNDTSLRSRMAESGRRFVEQKVDTSVVMERFLRLLSRSPER